MEKLRLKYAQKPWSETLKLVRICMVRMTSKLAGSRARVGGRMCDKRVNKKNASITDIKGELE